MKVINYIPVFFILFSCVEEIPIETELRSEILVENILVVEATITDEMKIQEVILSRGANFGNDSLVNYEQNAQVRVVDELGNTFLFTDNLNGQYLSTEPFAAQIDRTYQLFITTQSGEEFESEPAASVGVSTIENVYAERVVSDAGVEGMAIFVDSSNPSGSFNNYRYVYEETYKIVAPNWTSSEFEIINAEFEQIFDEETGELLETILPDVRLVPRLQEEQVCYNTINSNSIILSDELTINQNRLNRNKVRFINRNNPILSHRYSILVKQFLQSPDAANFYKTLLQFSQNDNLFSEIQPGLIEGNIKSTQNPDKIVIGFFEITSATEQRLFFDYSDFFPNEALPPYFNDLNCDEVFSPPLDNPLRDGPLNMDDCGFPRLLVSYIQAEDIEFFLSNASPPPLCEGPYLVTQRPCGDCTVLGSNVVPDFWIEE